MKLIIDLFWSDLKPINNIDYSKSEIGVYIWGFKYNGIFIPYYVGNAINIQKRLTQHVSYLISGQYCIIDSSCLKEFYKYKGPTTNKGLLYIPNYPKGYKSFLEKRKFLQPHIDNMVDRMCYSYSVFRDASTNSIKYLCQIENECINRIGITKLWNKQCGKNNEIIFNSIKGDKQVVGLFPKI
ncbi:MAG: hypothetical protein NTY74_14130 [Ignavibacteriae bacterium]|nr:hypothetical protein [Ignavibacteriota bacterium]